MRQYKKRIMVIVVSLICLLFVGDLTYKDYIRIQNLFDQMYYTRIRTHYDWWGGTLGGPGNEADSFSKMPQIEPISRDNESCYTSMGYFENFYMPDYLNEGERLSIYCDRDEEKVLIIALKEFDKFKICYTYTYDIKTKQMQEEIECSYGELYSGERNQYLEDFSEQTEDLQEILMIVKDYGLTKKDLLEYKKYFLYDKLLTDWLAANSSRFSIDKLGHVEFIEVLPLDDSVE